MRTRLPLFDRLAVVFLSFLLVCAQEGLLRGQSSSFAGGERFETNRADAALVFAALQSSDVKVPLRISSGRDLPLVSELPLLRAYPPASSFEEASLLRPAGVRGFPRPSLVGVVELRL